MGIIQPENRVIFDYFLIAVIVLLSVWPLPLHLNESLPAVPDVLLSTIISGDGDPYMFCWNLDWVRGFLSGKNSLAICETLHYPFGVNLAGHTITFTHGLLRFLLMYPLDSVTSHNLLLMFNGFLTGIGVYMLASHSGATGLWPLFAAMASIIWPSRIIHCAAHLNISATGWVPISLVILLRGLKKQKISWMIWAGITGAFGAGADWHHLLALVMILPALLISDLGAGFRKNIAYSGVMLSVIFVLAFPLAIPMLSSENEFESPAISELQSYSLKPELLLVPSPVHYFWGQYFSSCYTSKPGNAIETVVYIGFIPALLGLTGLVCKTSNTKAFYTASAVLLVFALGPVLKLGAYTLPLPYRLLHSIPGLSLSRTPARLWIYAGMMLSCAIAVALSSCKIRRLRSKSAVGIFGFLVFLEFLPFPMDRIEATKPGLISRIGHTSEERSHMPSQHESYSGILDLPADWNIRKYMWYQLIHKHPIVTGFVSRMPPQYFYRQKELPLLEILSSSGLTFQAIQQCDPIQWRDLIELMRISRILIHSNSTLQWDMEGLQNFAGTIGGDLVEADSEMALLKLTERKDLLQIRDDLKSAKIRGYFYRNWYAPEIWTGSDQVIRWISGKKGSIALITDFKRSAVTVKMQVLAAWKIAEADAVLQVSLNGEPVAGFPVSDSFTSIQFPLTNLDSNYMNILDLQMQDAIRPCNMSKESNDTRLLSIAVKDFQIAENEP